MIAAESSAIRLFFALEPDRVTRARVEALRDGLGWTGREVPADRLHVTLAFLGPVPAARVAVLRQLAEHEVIPETTIQLDRAGSFGRARVGWLGATTVPEPLRNFRDGLMTSLRGSGFRPDEKPWIFHLTVYRKLITRTGMMPVDPVVWTVRDFVLMQSNPTSAGPEYTVLGRWRSRPENGRRNPS